MMIECVWKKNRGMNCLKKVKILQKNPEIFLPKRSNNKRIQKVNDQELGKNRII